MSFRPFSLEALWALPQCPEEFSTACRDPKNPFFQNNFSANWFCHFQRKIREFDDLRSDAWQCILSRSCPAFSECRVFSAGIKIVVNTNLENTIWQCFWRLFNKVLWTIYTYLMHLESYYCILRWVKCIREVNFKKLLWIQPFSRHIFVNTDFRWPYRLFLSKEFGCSILFSCLTLRSHVTIKQC
jgi:hypothetical protein